MILFAGSDDKVKKMPDSLRALAESVSKYAGDSLSKLEGGRRTSDQVKSSGQRHVDPRKQAPGSHQSMGGHESPSSHQAPSGHQLMGSHQSMGTRQSPGTHKTPTGQQSMGGQQYGDASLGSNRRSWGSEGHRQGENTVKDLDVTESKSKDYDYEYDYEDEEIEDLEETEEDDSDDSDSSDGPEYYYYYYYDYPDQGIDISHEIKPGQGQGQGQEGLQYEPLPTPLWQSGGETDSTVTGGQPEREKETEEKQDM